MHFAGFAWRLAVMRYLAYALPFVNAR